VNPNVTPGVLATIGRTADANACTNDAGTNVDGLNTICFNESSNAFTNGVLAFTRTITANAAGVSVGGGAPAAFAGQLLDSDTLFDNTGQSRFATPAALGTAAAAGAYDLESLVTHELGHYFGLDHSAVRRAILFPFAPPPGTFIGDRPTTAAPDGMLANDDRTGLRAIYPDSADAVHIGEIHGRIIPANAFALAPFAATSPGESVTGIFGTQVAAVDADTGEIFAAGFGGWSCDAANDTPRFDGTYRIERLPVGGNYKVYVEPLDGLATAAAFFETMNGICERNGATPCTAPSVNTNLTMRIKPD